MVEYLSPVVAFEPADPQDRKYDFNKPLHPGWYRGAIIKISVAMSSKNKPQIRAIIGINDEKVGTVGVMHYVPTMPCSFRSEFFGAIGHVEADTTKEPIDVRQWRGLALEIKIKTEMYEGEPRNKVAALRALDNDKTETRDFPAKDEEEKTEYGDEESAGVDLEARSNRNAAATSAFTEDDDIPF